MLGLPIPIFGGSLSIQSPRIVASQSFGQSNATSGFRSVSVSYPSGTEPGDLVVALATAAGNATLSSSTFRAISGPEGWAPVTSSGSARNIQTTTGAIAWQTLMRVAQPGDNNFTFQAFNSNRLNVSLVVIRGAALPLDAISHSVVTSGGTLSGLTVLAERATLLLLGGFANNSTADPSVTGPGTAAEILSYTQASGHQGGSRNWAGHEYDVPAGATGNRVWTENSTSNILAMLSLASGSPGAWLYDKATIGVSTMFEVPEGVTSANILCIGAGGRNWPGTSGGQGGGGACAWSNGVPVTPGELLTVNVGQSLAWNTHNTDDCASYVKRGGTTLVLADYGRPATPTASPGVAIPGAGGLSTNSVGDSRVAGTSGDNAANTGGQCGTPYGYTASAANQFGIGISAIGTFMQSDYGGIGAGANQLPSQDRAGSTGGVIITWGRNRSFGQSGGRFV